MGVGAYLPRSAHTTSLYRVVSDERETFLSEAQDRGRAVPRFVERELRAFLECGIPQHGFMRVRCPKCPLDLIVPFSCKGRGVWPSCGGRRMADTAAHLVDRLLPRARLRQWVLSLPIRLRNELAFDPALTSRDDLVRSRYGPRG